MFKLDEFMMTLEKLCTVCCFFFLESKRRNPDNGDFIKWYGSTSKAFIFSLLNKEKRAPFKSMVKNPEKAIYNYRWYGSTFGNNDLLINRAGNSRRDETITNFGNYYYIPDNVKDSKTILAGVYKFYPDEVEVFYLN